MKFLVAIVVIVAMDRIFPINAKRFWGPEFRADAREYYRQYKMVSFPRTPLAISLCFVVSFGEYIPISQDIVAIAIFILAITYGGSAWLDILRARERALAKLFGPPLE